MAASDRFLDLYEILEISPSAHPETIHRVYRFLAQVYHPDNRETGSEETFRQIVEAYRTLNDPQRRAAYDAEHREYLAARRRVFSAPAMVEDFERERRKRRAILTALYTQRACHPHHPSLGVVELEARTGAPREEMELALWYLRETGMVVRSDSGHHAITVKGLEALESMPAPKSAARRDEPASELPSLAAPIAAGSGKPRFILTTLR